MRLLSFIALLLFFTFSAYHASAQTEVALSSRHKLTDAIIGLRLDERGLFASYGFAVDLIRDQNRFRAYALGAGFRTTNHDNDDLGTTTEFFVQGRIRLSSNFVKTDWLRIYLGFAPRLVYLFNNEFQRDFDTFPREGWSAGVEVPLPLSIDIKVNERIRFHAYLNTLSAAAFFDRQVSSDPILTIPQSINSGFDIDVTVLNEFRIGIGYLFGEEE